MKTGPIKTIRFIRHAESAANAGLPTTDPGEIPITEEGRTAAERAALEYNGPAPELIVVSPYLRAGQTAEPLIARFPGASVERTWPVQEFTYISRDRCVGTTYADRKPMVQAYWDKAATGYVDGPQTESFEEFIARVAGTLARVRQRAEENIVVVCHGIFMQAAEFYQDRNEDPATPESMRRFCSYMLDFRVPNLGCIDATVNAQGEMTLARQFETTVETTSEPAE